MQQTRAEKDITFARIILIEYTITICALLYCVHMTTYNQINEKCPRVPIIHFCILVGSNIRGHFVSSLSVRVSDSGQLVHLNRKYVMERTCHNLQNCTPACFKWYNTLLHTYKSNIQQYFCTILSSAPEKIVQDKNVTIYKTTTTHSSHIIVHFYIWQHLRTIFSRFENRFHQVGSFFLLIQ